MASIKCNGLAVFDCEITRPIAGRWFARLRVDSAERITGAVVIETPGLELRGTVADALSGVDTNVAELVVYGGAGGMTKEIAARDYVGVTVRIVAEDIARDVGETLSTTIDAALLDMPVTRWTRLRGTAGGELKTLLDTVLPGKRWRILEDGTLWFGEHTFPELHAVGYTLTETAATSGEKTIAADRPILSPGVTFEGDRVFEVVDNFAEPAVRQRYNTRKPSADKDRDDFKSRAEPVIEPLRVFAAKVVEHASVGASVELWPDDERFPAMSRVPIGSGVPGVAVKVKPGARCYVMFERGDRRRPFVVGWDCKPADVERIELAGGTKPVAREGDAVDCGSISGTVTPAGAVVLVHYPAGTPAPPGAVPIMGKVGRGAEKVKA